LVKKLEIDNLLLPWSKATDYLIYFILKDTSLLFALYLTVLDGIMQFKILDLMIGKVLAVKLFVVNERVSYGSKQERLNGSHLSDKMRTGIKFDEKFLDNVSHSLIAHSQTYTVSIELIVV